MGRMHPTFCEHGKCIYPGDESFGLKREDCDQCNPVADDPPLWPADLVAERDALKAEVRRLLGLIEKLTEKQVDLQAEIARLRGETTPAPH